jgi:hypothetical protein
MLRGMCWLGLSMIVGTLTHCTPVLQGESVDLETIVRPDPPAQAVPVAPQAVAPDPEQSRFRAWVPREVAVNGDAVEGHYIDISSSPLPNEAVEPSKPIPRAPKHVPAQPSKPRVRMLPATTAPQAPPGAGQLPPGFGLTPPDMQGERYERLP